MKELSLNILDIAQNSVKANAERIDIQVIESEANDLVSIRITDNGCGMTEEFLKKVIDPFTTTRTTRKVGLGIPLLRQQALDTEGTFDIKSKVGEGTSVYADFKMTHLDRAPIGDMPLTIMSLISAGPDIRYVYSHSTDKGNFVFDTDEIKSELDGVSITEPEILMWLTDYIKENLLSIEGGKI